jgi:hypothetical protein
MTDVRDYLRRYLNITWVYDGLAYIIRVDQYLNADGPRYRDKSVKAWEALWDAAPDELRQAKEEGKPKFKDRFTLAGAPYLFENFGIWCTFRGKASPDTIKATCWLAMHWGLIEQRKPSQQEPPPGFEVVPPQEFADNYLGTDCSGFVNCFHGRRKGHMKIKKYDLDKAQRRKDGRSIKEGDILMSEGHGHIAVVYDVDSMAGDAYRVWIAESWGGEEGDIQIGVTDKHPREMKLVSPDEGLFQAIKKNRKGEYKRYIFQPPQVAGNPVP